MIGVGERESSKISGGPNDGKAYDYALDAQQLTAAFDYASLGSCGLHNGFLYDSTYANTTVTFACNAGLGRADSPTTPTRSELQIDGANAYAPTQAFFINSGAAGLPCADRHVHGRQGHRQRRDPRDGSARQVRRGDLSADHGQLRDLRLHGRDR